MPPIRTVAVLPVVAVLLLSACSGPASTPPSDRVTSEPAASEPGTAGTAVPEPTASPAEAVVAGADVGVDAPCELLDAAAVSRLVGTELSKRTEHSVGKMPACVWGSLHGPGVQVASVPAEVWGATVPDLLDQMLESGSPLVDATMATKLREAQEMVRQGELLGAEASCEIFSTMAELNGTAPGSDYTLSYIPDLDEPIAVSGQACTDGRYLSVLVVPSQVEVSAATEARLVEALADLAGA